MKLLIILASLTVVFSASDYEKWQDFKQKFSKTHNLGEEGVRFKIFQDNLRKIEEHNAKYEKGEVSYFLKVTQFSDWTAEEFQDMLMSQVSSEPKIEPIGTFKSNPNITRPDTFDWRAQNAVLEVKNQGLCGSCWAFSAIAGLESQLIIKRNQRISLSEQELVSCNKNSAGCTGGWLDSALNYVQTNGVSSEEQYPYIGMDSVCRTNLANKPLTSIQGHVLVGKDEEAIADAVATVGPVSVYVAAYTNWQLYGGGIFDDPSCGNNYNHAVLITGYDFNSWSIKNSWGTGWGEGGYLRLVRGKNQCGITVFPIYPVL